MSHNLRINAELLLACLLGAGLLVIYVPLLSPMLTSGVWGSDGGDLMAAVLTNGNPHPPGYPTYMLLAGQLQKLPGSNPLIKGALASLLPAMAALGGLAWLVGRVFTGSRNPWTGPAAVVCLALTPLFTWQAVSIEVYALNSFFFVGGLWLIKRLLEGASSLTAVVVLWVLFGLGLGNHLTLALLLPALFYAFWRGVPQPQRWKTGALSLAGLLLGLAVYLSLPLRAVHFPPVNWGNPQDPAGFWWLVSGGPYRGYLFNIQASEILPRLGSWARLLLTQFGLPAFLTGVWGAFTSGRQLKAWRPMLIWSFLAYSIYAIGYRANDSQVYLAPAWIIFSIWVAIGLGDVWLRRWKGLRLGWAVLVLILAGSAIQLPGTIRTIRQQNDSAGAAKLEAALLAAPPGAMLASAADAELFGLWYTHYGLGLRPDVHVIARPLLGYDWYRQTLEHTYPDLKIPALSNDADPWMALRRANPALPACEIGPEGVDNGQVYCDFNIFTPILPEFYADSN